MLTPIKGWTGKWTRNTQQLFGLIANYPVATGNMQREVVDLKHFYDAKDVQQLLECGSIRTAQLRIQKMNEELQAQGYWTEKGKVPIQFFHEKYPYIKQLGGETA